jgi:hypothetical protein
MITHRTIAYSSTGVHRAAELRSQDRARCDRGGADVRGGHVHNSRFRPHRHRRGRRTGSHAEGALTT